ncbi:MAG: ABC transporter permease [Anaerolineae bacterium]|nr:ABC transporter permease [Anaerolineae bacterium]
MRRLSALMRKEFTHMRRDPRTLMYIFVMPLMQLFLLGYAANTDVQNVSTAIIDQDRSRASRALLDAYRASGYFLINHVAENESEIVDLIDSGEAQVGIIIPPGYARDIDSGGTAQVAVLIDGSDAAIAGSALSAATLVGQSHATRIRSEQVAVRMTNASGSLPVEVRTRVLYNPDLLSSYNMIPGLIGTILQMTTMMLTSLAIVRERERGTIEQLIVTPVRNWELMVAKITPYILVSMINVVIVLLVGTFWFGVPIRGSVPLLFALTGLFIVPNLGIGLLISTFANTQQEAQFATFPIILPSFFLSGFLFPLAALPPLLQLLSGLIPLRYFLVIVRSVIVKGVGFEVLISQVIALIIFSIVLVGIAILRFRKSLD